jgi:hypothetical protein
MPATDAPTVPGPEPAISRSVHLSPLDADAIAALADRVSGAEVVVKGPPGSGRSTAGARLGGDAALVMALEEVILELVRPRGGMPAEARQLLDAPRLVIDEVGWLVGRPRALAEVQQLLQHRAEQGGTTILIEERTDGSMESLASPSALVVQLSAPNRAERAAWSRSVGGALGLDPDSAEVEAAARVEPWLIREARAALQQAAGETELRLA